jgi:hypothetical protein
MKDTRAFYKDVMGFPIELDYEPLAGSERLHEHVTGGSSATHTGCSR